MDNYYQDQAKNAFFVLKLAITQRAKQKTENFKAQWGDTGTNDHRLTEHYDNCESIAFTSICTDLMANIEKV